MVLRARSPCIQANHLIQRPAAYQNGRAGVPAARPRRTLAAVARDGMRLPRVSPPWLVEDKEVVLAAVRGRGAALVRVGRAARRPRGGRRRARARRVRRPLRGARAAARPAPAWRTRRRGATCGKAGPRPSSARRARAPVAWLPRGRGGDDGGAAHPGGGGARRSCTRGSTARTRRRSAASRCARASTTSPRWWEGGANGPRVCAGAARRRTARARTATSASASRPSAAACAGARVTGGEQPARHSEKIFYAPGRETHPQCRTWARRSGGPPPPVRRLRCR